MEQVTKEYTYMSLVLFHNTAVRRGVVPQSHHKHSAVLSEFIHKQSSKENTNEAYLITAEQSGLISKQNLKIPIGMTPSGKKWLVTWSRNGHRCTVE